MIIVVFSNCCSVISSDNTSSYFVIVCFFFLVNLKVKKWRSSCSHENGMKSDVGATHRINSFSSIFPK